MPLSKKRLYLPPEVTTYGMLGVVTGDIPCSGFYNKSTTVPDDTTPQNPPGPIGNPTCL